MPLALISGDESSSSGYSSSPKEEVILDLTPKQVIASQRLVYEVRSGIKASTSCPML